MKKIIIFIICFISILAGFKICYLVTHNLSIRPNIVDTKKFSSLGQNDALLAAGLLHGDLSLPIPSDKFLIQDTIFIRDRVYIAFAPLPAILLMPLVYVFGPYFITQVILSLLATIASFFIILKILDTLKITKDRFSMIVWFFFGSFYLIDMFAGNVWTLQHTIGIMFILAAILAAFKRLPIIYVGFLISAAFLSREPLIFYAPLVLYIYFKDQKLSFWQVCTFFIPLIMSAVILLSYNFVRFGDFLEFGHNINFSSILDLKRDAPYGLFNIKYLIRNLIVMISYPPLTPDFVHGISNPVWRNYYLVNAAEPIPSVFLTMLAPIVFLFKTNYRKRINIIIVLTILAFLLTTLTWFRLNTSDLVDSLPAFLLLFIFVVKNNKLTTKGLSLLTLFSVLFMSYWFLIYF